MRVALVLLAVLLGAGAAAADDPPVTPDDVQEALRRFATGDAERRALAAVQVWSWLDQHPDAARAALRVAAPSSEDEAGEEQRLLEALRATTAPCPSLAGGPATPPALVAALRASPPRGRGDPLADAVDYLRFTDALERAPDVDAALAELAASVPGHPWLTAVAATRAKVAVARAAATALEPLGLPDPARATRCAVRWWDRPAGRLSFAVEEVHVDVGWLVREDERELVLFSDALGGPRVVPRRPAPPEVVAAYGTLPRVEPLDLVAESRAWLLAPPPAVQDLPRGVQALLRAAWHVRRGESFLAGRLARLAQIELGATDEELVGYLRSYVADGAWSCALEALGAGAPRLEAAARVAAVVDLLTPVTTARPNVWLAEGAEELLARAVALRDGLEAQARLDALRPAPPTWAEWQTWSTAQRLACLLDHLRDEAATPSGMWGEVDPTEARAPFPPGAPAGNATDRLRELGDAALPPLVELLVDLGPTRSIEDDRLGTAHDVASLAQLAERCLERLWRERLLESPQGRGASLAAWRAKRARARAWLAEWGPRGGLGAWHAARIDDPSSDAPARVRHGVALLRRDPARARSIVPRLHAELRTAPEGDEELLVAIGDAADPAYRELLAGELDRAPLEAALGLARLSDPRGAARFAELSRAGVDLDLQAYERLAGAGAAEAAGRLLLERSNQAPWSDWRLVFASPPLPDPDALLALARAVVRQRGETREYGVAQLERRVGARRPLAELVVTALSQAALDRPDRAEHAAATVLTLGLDAVAAFEALGGPAVRPRVLGALASGDLARVDAVTDALGSAGRAAFDWVREGLPSDDPRLALLARAHLQASLRVREAGWAEAETETEADSFAGVGGWWCSAWDPAASVAALLARWRADASARPAFSLRIERRADARGVDVRFTPAPPGPPGLTAQVVAPGLERAALDEAALGPLLGDLARALALDPDAPATLSLTVRR